jgi:hypothetical protein
MKGIASTGAPKTVLGGWVGGWVDGWVGGRESGVKDCLQQSKIEFNSSFISDCVKYCFTCFGEYNAFSPFETDLQTCSLHLIYCQNTLQTHLSLFMS